MLKSQTRTIPSFPAFEMLGVVKRGHSGNPRGINFDTENPPGNTNPDDNPDDEPEFKMTQTALDKTISRRLAAEKKKFDADKAAFENSLNEAKAEIEKLKKAPVKPDDKGNPDPEKYIPKSEWDNQRTKIETEWGTKVQNLETQVASLLGEKKRSAVISAASRANAMNPEVVAELIEKHVAYDDENAIFFKDAKGDPRIGPKGEYLTADEFIAEFATANPYMFKSSATPGGGSDQKTKNGKPNQNASPLDKITAGLRSRNQ